MDIFANHIVDRISLTNPGTTAFFIYSIILAAIFLSISKAPKKQEFLNFSQTEQLRGIAILLIILGHLKTNVLARNDYLSFYFGDCGVSLFLFLSGYGLMRSHQAKNATLSHFIKRRVNRVFIPYWITTLLFLLLDYYLLSETYPLKLIILTVLGLNFNLKLQLLDYGRWFITFILFFYLLFYLATRFKQIGAQMLILIAVPIAMCYLNYFFQIITPYNPPRQLTHLSPALGGWNPWHLFLLLFPAGFLAGAYIEKLKRVFPAPERFQWNGLPLAVLFLSLFLFIGRTTVTHSFYGIFYTSLIINLSRICLALFVIFIFAFFSSFNIQFRILSLLGFLSYELYLLHDAFMVKYDFMLFRLPVKYSFPLFLLVISILAYALRRVASANYFKIPGRRQR